MPFACPIPFWVLPVSCLAVAVLFMVVCGLAMRSRKSGGGCCCWERGRAAEPDEPRKG